MAWKCWLKWKGIKKSIRAYAERSVNTITKLLVTWMQNLIYSASCWLPEGERESWLPDYNSGRNTIVLKGNARMFSKI